MSASSLVQFGASAMTVTIDQPKQKATTIRLLSAKEFKDSKGVKGTEAKRLYHEYLRENGTANTAGLMAACASGDLLVKRVKRYDKTGNFDVSFISKAGLKDPEEPKADNAILDENAKLRALLKSLGATAADLAAASAGRLDPVPAAPAA